MDRRREWVRVLAHLQQAAERLEAMDNAEPRPQVRHLLHEIKLLGYATYGLADAETDEGLSAEARDERAQLRAAGQWVDP